MAKSKALIISFSLQQDSQSLKVTSYLQKVWGKSAEILDLFQNPLPLWEEEVWENTEKWQKLLIPIKEKLQNAESFVFVVPEYNGAPSPSYYNFMLFLGLESSHKPVLITTVSSDGTYPVLGIAFGYKNIKINFIPEHLIIQNVENEEYKNCEFMQEKIAFTLNILDIYATNFVSIRKEIQFNQKFQIWNVNLKIRLY